MAQEYIEERNGGFYVKGTRVPLDLLVYGFQHGDSPETIRGNYETLTLEQVYGAITFYLSHKEEVERTMAERERMEEEFAKTHPIPESIREKLARARQQMARPH